MQRQFTLLLAHKHFQISHIVGNQEVLPYGPEHIGELYLVIQWLARELINSPRGIGRQHLLITGRGVRTGETLHMDCSAGNESIAKLCSDRGGLNHSSRPLSSHPTRLGPSSSGFIRHETELILVVD